MKQLTRGEATELAHSRAWETWDDEQIVKFQLFQERPIVPFPLFHTALERVLGRSVWVHEFADSRKLIDEYLKERPTPTLSDPER